MNRTYAVIRCFIRQRILRLYPLPIEIFRHPKIVFTSIGEDGGNNPIILYYGDKLDIDFAITSGDGLIISKRNLIVEYNKDDDIDILLTKLYKKIPQLMCVTINESMENAIKKLMKLEEDGVIETDKCYSVYYIKEE